MLENYNIKKQLVKKSKLKGNKTRHESWFVPKCEIRLTWHYKIASDKQNNKKKLNGLIEVTISMILKITYV